MIFVLFFLAVGVLPPKAEAHEIQRPKIGVVLGGGGAKGAAHVGVLKALEELHIPVDYIAGTSMGAYVGGLYATGMSADEIEALLTSVDWERGYQDRVERSDRRVREKQQEDRFQIKSEIGFDWWELKAPRGIVQGQTMGEILRTTSGNLPVFDSFDDLVIPFRAVATDIETLKPVVLDRGDLAEAMQASMSIPGLLPPMNLQGRLLVDGGITNNLPVDVVRAMGADIVIAVDISNDFKSRDELSNYFAVMDQLTDFMVRDNSKRQIALLKDGDLLIRPAIQGINTADFAKMPEAFERGYQATMSEALTLAPMGQAVWFQDYVDHKQLRRRDLSYLDQLHIDELILVNNSSFADSVLLDRLQLEAGDTITSEQLAESVRNLYALDRFERVDYRIEENPAGNNAILLDVREKSWGPNFIDLRFALEDDFENSTDYSIGVAFNVTGLNQAGAEWRSELEYGTDKRIATELYLPFINEPNLFTLFSAEYKIADKNIIFSGDEPSLDDIGFFIPATYTDYILDSSVGWQPELWQEFRLGARYIYGDTEYVGVPGVSAGKRESKAVYVSYQLDTLDDFMLPKWGNSVDVSMALSDENYDDGNVSNRDMAFELDVNWRGAYTFGNHTFMGKAEYGQIDYTLSALVDPKEIGGFLNLSGIPKNGLTGNNKLFGAAIYRYHLAEQDFGLFKSSVFLGGSVEYGGVYNDPELGFSDRPLYTAGSVFTGITTPLGPLIVAYGQTEQNNNSFYLFFGGAL